MPCLSCRLFHVPNRHYPTSFKCFTHPSATHVFKACAPQVMNQLNNDLILDICAAAEAFEENSGVGALVLTGSGEEAFAGERLMGGCFLFSFLLFYGFGC